MSSPVRKIISILYLPWVFFLEKILGRHGVRILMFHSIAEEHVNGIDNQAVIELPPRRFSRLIRYLVPRYRFISLAELVEMITQQIDLPKRTLALTFDDGYANNFTEALPSLKKFKLRATIFMSSGFVGKPNYLDPAMLKQLISEHIELGGHTVSHPTLSKLDSESAYNEIVNGKKELEAITGSPLKYFAYPKGKLIDYTPEVTELVKKAGFQAACTTNRGTNTLKTPLFELRRVGIDGHDSFFNIWLKLHGGYDWTGTISRLKARLKK